jgi:aldehyde:ferredoxin oxidoreductase
MWEKGYILLYIKAHNKIKRNELINKLDLDHIKNEYIDNMVDKFKRKELVKDDEELEITTKGDQVINKLFNRNPHLNLVLVSNDKEKIMSYQEAYKSGKEVIHDFNNKYEAFRRARNILN